MGASTEPNEFARGRGFFKRKIPSNIFLDYTDNLHRTLQILASSYF